MAKVEANGKSISEIIGTTPDTSWTANNVSHVAGGSKKKIVTKKVKLPQNTTKQKKTSEERK